MKITSAVLAFITAVTAVWGATLRSREHRGANQTSRAHARTHAGKRASASCSTDGFDPPGFPSCVCNFAGACQPGTATRTPAAVADPTNLVGIAPQGIDAMAYDTPNLGKVCEDGIVAALYDCNARTSLYSATRIDGATASATGKRKDCWKSTTDAKLIKQANYLVKHDDYENSNKRTYCYEAKASKAEFEWDGSSPCAATGPNIQIHKGHLIAARYGHTRGNPDATFTYTNAVPQEGGFNSGKWRSHEASVTEMAAKCQVSAAAKAQNAYVYVVVGVIPSTFLGKPRFFGSAGFGEYQGASKIRTTKEYRVSFPEYMWTAACCVHTDGTVHDKLAFWRRNWKDRTDPVKDHTTVSSMLVTLNTEMLTAWGKPFTTVPTIFPGKPACNT